MESVYLETYESGFKVTERTFATAQFGILSAETTTFTSYASPRASRRASAAILSSRFSTRRIAASSSIGCGIGR